MDRLSHPPQSCWLIKDTTQALSLVSVGLISCSFLKRLISSVRVNSAEAHRLGSNLSLSAPRGHHIPDLSFSVFRLLHQHDFCLYKLPPNRSEAGSRLYKNLFCGDRQQIVSKIQQMGAKGNHSAWRWCETGFGGDKASATYTCHSQHTFHRGEEQVEKPDCHQSMHRGSQPGPDEEWRPITNKLFSVCLFVFYVRLKRKITWLFRIQGWRSERGFGREIVWGRRAARQISQHPGLLTGDGDGRLTQQQRAGRSPTLTSTNRSRLCNGCSGIPSKTQPFPACPGWWRRRSRTGSSADLSNSRRTRRAREPQRAHTWCTWPWRTVTRHQRCVQSTCL